MKEIVSYEDGLLDYATNLLEQVEGLHIVGTAAQKTAVLSFVIDGIHASDLGTLLDQMGVAIRTGNHCAQPLIDNLGLNGVARITLGLYNTKEEIDIMFGALQKAISMLK